MDSSFLINFLALDRMDILGRLPHFRFHVVNHVSAEIRYEDQRRRLQTAIETGIVTEIVRLETRPSRKGLRTSSRTFTATSELADRDQKPRSSRSRKSSEGESRSRSPSGQHGTVGAAPILLPHHPETARKTVNQRLLLKKV